MFLGAVPGAGTTYAMLQEGRRLAENGRHVVIGTVCDAGRPRTVALREALPGIPPLPAAHPASGAASGPDGDGEPDIEALLARFPDVVLIDDYAHRQTGGRPRWQEVDELLEAGIDVISTLEIQYLVSLVDAIESITGVRAAETVPDELVRRADQIELVDIAPEMLRERLLEGRIYPAEQVDAALAGYFRLGNLRALRELALLWLADQVDEGLERYRSARGIDAYWPARERLVVGLTGGREGELLIRRAARILSRVRGGELLAVHVRSADGASDESPEQLEAQRQLVTDLGGTYHAVAGDDSAEALLDFARSVNATQIVVGVARQRFWARLLTGAGVAARVVRDSGDIDVHMVSHSFEGEHRRRSAGPGLGTVRTVTGLVLAAVLPVLATGVLLAVGHRSFAGEMLIYLGIAVIAAIIGGLWPALLAALLGSLLLNFFFAEPVGTFIIADPEKLFELCVFVGVAVAVALVVGYAARRAREASVAGAEAATLSELARGALARENTLQGFLDQVRENFQVRSASLLVREPASDTVAAEDAGSWRVEASAGERPPLRPEEAENVEQINDSTVLAVAGRTLQSSDRRLLSAFGAHVLALRQEQQLHRSREDVLRLAEGNKMRTAILRAVSHDLRTPLAGIKLAVTSLRQEGVSFSAEEEKELLATIEDYSDRLDALVGNLLDMSRITGESITPLLRPVTWLEVLPEALSGLPPSRVRVELPPNLPPVQADLGMLERVIANVVENAAKYAPESDIVVVASAGGAGGSTVAGAPASELRVIDHGRGVPVDQVLAIFQPFQRLDDVAGSTGVGLGLAVAKGFTEAMGGELQAEPTPGGGLTVVVRLPLSAGVSVERSMR